MTRNHGTIAFWTEAPPKKDNAPGTQGVARHFCEILKDRLSLVVTRRFSRGNSRDRIEDAAETQSVALYPDGSRWGVRKIFGTYSGLFEQLLFAAYLPLLARELRKHNTSRAFVLCGADGWIIPQVLLFQRFIGIPLDLYLVDDIEDWIAHCPRHLLKSQIHSLLGNVLCSADRVFTISPGFANHLKDRFGVTPEWLPLPSSNPPPVYHRRSEPIDDHRITYIGNFSHLYEDSLRDTYSAITYLNEIEGGIEGIPLILEILTSGDSAAFEKSLPHTRWLSVKKGLSDEECLQRFRTALACLLPYSFKESERLMVSTSFSCKILDYFKAGRPILAYGPHYASIPRYFRENGWPLCAETYENLISVIRTIPLHDGPDLIESYRETLIRLHSEEAIKRILSY